MDILREMTQARLVLPGRPGVPPSNREIARKLKLPPGTVRYRILRMYDSGIIRGSSIFPNPSLLGLKAMAFTVDVSPLLDKSKVVGRLRKVEGVISMHDFVGSLVWAVFVYEDDRSLEIKKKAMKEIAGSDGFFSTIPYPPCNSTLTRPEAELMLRLLRSGFNSYGSLAREQGVSLKTLHRRLSKIVSENAVISLPKVDYLAMTDCVPADLVILFKSKDAARNSQQKILPLIEKHVILAALWDVVGMCSMILTNISAMAEIAGKINSVDGVAMARVEIVREHIDQMNALDSYAQRFLVRKDLEVGPILGSREA